MTNDQIFFQLTTNLEATNHLNYVIKTEVDRPGSDRLVGIYKELATLETQREELLKEYANSLMIILRCGECDSRPFWTPIDKFFDGSAVCENCGRECQRLLSNGAWQSDDDRRQENINQLERITK